MHPQKPTSAQHDTQLDFKKWRELKTIIIDRLKRPLQHPEFIFYFVVVVFIGGMLGVFITIYSEGMKEKFGHKELTFSIATTFIVLIASSSADLIIAEDSQKGRLLRITGFSLLVFGLAFFVFTYLCVPFWSYVFSIIGMLVALLTWWIANANNSNLTPKINAENAIPEPTDNNIKGNQEQYNL